jgi:hypothetical protein
MTHSVLKQGLMTKGASTLRVLAGRAAVRKG